MTFYNKRCKRSSGSQLSNVYGLSKIHKRDCPVHPIVAAYRSFNINLAKQLVLLISQLAVNPYILKNSYGFTDILHTLSDADNSFMYTLDISTFYSNIPVTGTIGLILDNIFY